MRSLDLHPVLVLLDGRAHAGWQCVVVLELALVPADAPGRTQALVDGVDLAGKPVGLRDAGRQGGVDRRRDVAAAVFDLARHLHAVLVHGGTEVAFAGEVIDVDESGCLVVHPQHPPVGAVTTAGVSRCGNRQEQEGGGELRDELAHLYSPRKVGVEKVLH